jgi:hypothetical protein
MPWTTPKTWSSGETLTAANFNAHIRDNLGAVPHIIPKSADETVSASTTMQDDDHLFLAIGASDIWQIHLFLWHSASSTGHLKITFTGPTSSTFMAIGRGVDTGGSTFGQQNIRSAADSAGFFSGTTNQISTVDGVIVGGGTAGNFQLQWAQNSATGTTTIKRGSVMFAVKLA